MAFKVPQNVSLDPLGEFPQTLIGWGGDTPPHNPPHLGPSTQHLHFVGVLPPNIFSRISPRTLLKFGIK